ncbi:MAG TPA: holdfast anchoring protein HfaB [Caulobacteraceae bacterium]|jgi:curli biogenesis system outer membrane secretion channel CsgG
MLNNTFTAGKRVVALLATAGMTLAGCAAPVAKPDGLYSQPTGNAPVVSNPTPYTDALVCEAQYARAHGVNAPRIAIGRIADYTGKLEADGSGRKVTQGASLMAMTAFAKAGVPLVERYDTSVSEMELKYANAKLISDKPVAEGASPADFRRIMAGQVPGSDFYVAGGITELNFNIRSNGINVDAGGLNTTDLKGTAGATTYVMNVGLDLRLVNTRTLEVVDVISYQKQIVAHQVGVGLFKIWNNASADVGLGEGALEPLQLGVRAVIERAAVEMVANLYGMPGPQACMHYDPLGDNVTTGPTGAYIPAYNNVGTNNAATRQEPNRWDARRDPDMDAVVRDRY